MNDEKLMTRLDDCVDCKACLDVCDTYLVTQDMNKSPNGRLTIVKKIAQKEEIKEEEILGLYTCTLCAACELACTQDLPIAELIHAGKIKLVEAGKAPLEIHEKIIKGILTKDNSVNGAPEERLDWLPQEYHNGEKFEESSSDTLLFLGCMSSFRVKESASAPYIILKKADYDFKIFKEEPCCGEYVYSAGKIEEAKKIFEENIERFKNKGIKRIVVTCGGCLYAFDKVYRKYFPDFDLEIRHVVDVIHELVDQGKLNLKPINKTITLHDACRVGRKYKNGPLFNQQRALLKKCGVELKELTENHEECPCCGAGSGIRGVDSSICIAIGAEMFKSLETKELASSCPLCVFNFRYVNYKNQTDIESKYLTDYVLEAFK